VTRADVVADALAWLDTEFIHQASLRGVGSDCIGLVGGIARDRGTPDGLAWAADQEFKGYSRTPNPRTLLAGTEKYLERIRIDEARPGDVLLMRFTDEPQHFSILTALEPPYIVHASNTRKRVVEHRLDDVWRSRVIRAYRYRDLQ
jgi:NlpC/P60 family putative phage cell wall peptidase